MKKIMALAAAALALAGALTLAGCAPRADGAAHSTRQDGTTPQGGAPANPAPNPPAATAPVNTGSVDSNLNNVDKLLGGVDSDLSAAADSSHDAD